MANTTFNEYHFTKSGDLDTGYGIIIWEAAQEDTTKCFQHTTLKPVARYMIMDTDISFLDDASRNQVEILTVSV